MTETPADTSQTLRDLVDEVLREGTGGNRLNLWKDGTPYDIGGVTQAVEKLAKKRGMQFDSRCWPPVIEHVWTLARLGALALMPQDPPIAGSMLPQEQRPIPTFIVTELGRKLLNEPGYSPHDWAKYKAATLLRVKAPDDVVVAHLEEAVIARQTGLYRASLVMLGCACERLILLLAAAVRDHASLPPYSKNLQKLLASSKPAGILQLFEQVRDALIEGPLSQPLREEVDLNLGHIFQYARALRNSHGHPTGTPVTAEQADSGLKLFPGFYALVDRLIAALPPAPAALAPVPAGGAT
jgi:hypothetical protein